MTDYTKRAGRGKYGFGSPAAEIVHDGAPFAFRGGAVRLERAGEEPALDAGELRFESAPSRREVEPFYAPVGGIGQRLEHAPLQEVLHRTMERLFAHVEDGEKVAHRKTRFSSHEEEEAVVDAAEAPLRQQAIRLLDDLAKREVDEGERDGKLRFARMVNHVDSLGLRC